MKRSVHHSLQDYALVLITCDYLLPPVLLPPLVSHHLSFSSNLMKHTVFLMRTLHTTSSCNRIQLDAPLASQDPLWLEGSSQSCREDMDSAANACRLSQPQPESGVCVFCCVSLFCFSTTSHPFSHVVPCFSSLRFCGVRRGELWKVSRGA